MADSASRGPSAAVQLASRELLVFTVCVQEGGDSQVLLGHVSSARSSGSYYHSSILIRTITKRCQHDILSVAAKYINRLDNSVSSIKKCTWQTFAASVVYVFDVFLMLSVYVSLLFILFCMS